MTAILRKAIHRLIEHESAPVLAAIHYPDGHTDQFIDLPHAGAI